MNRVFLVSAFIVYFACPLPGDSPEPKSKKSTALRDVEITVQFTGLVTHFLGPHQKASIVYTLAHAHEVSLPYDPAIAGIVIEKLDGYCGKKTCRFPINYVAMQLIGGDKTPLTGALVTDKPFDDYVTPLRFANVFDAHKIEKDAFSVREGSKVSWGTFDLHGGRATAIAFGCTGHFWNETAHDFVKMVTVTYTLPGGAYLRVQSPPLSVPVDIPLSESVTITINNDLPDEMSHFHEYSKLSTDKPHLPDVKVEKISACRTYGERGGIPGCSNTQWP